MPQEPMPEEPMARGETGTAPETQPGAAAKPPILFVNLSRGWGGGEVWHLTMAQALAGRGWPVTLLVHPDGALAQRAEAAGLPTRRMALRTASLLNPVKLVRLVRFLKRLRPRTAILNASHELKVVGLMAKQCGVPHIVFRRGIPQALSAGWINRWYLRHVATGLIANSLATLDAMVRGFPDLVRRLEPEVIHNGIDPEGWAPPSRPPEEGWIGVVGRLTEEKGVDRAIRALAVARERFPAARLMVIGDGAERKNLERLAASLGLAEAVRFVGQTAEVARHLRECDVFCLPSRWEGFGYVLLEAMLLALPCVAFDIFAAREVVVTGETGVLVPDGNEAALGAVLADLLAEPERRRRLGQAGRERALAIFPIRRAVERLERLLSR